MAVAIALVSLAAPTVVGARGRFADYAESSLGSVSVGPDGDLVGANPSEALRARVNRMLRNPSGAYAHLGKWGALLRVKGLAKPSEVARYQIDTAAMLEGDADIRSARVTLMRLADPRSWVLDVAVVDRFGNPDHFTAPVPGA